MVDLLQLTPKYTERNQLSYIRFHCIIKTRFRKSCSNIEGYVIKRTMLLVVTKYDWDEVIDPRSPLFGPESIVTKILQVYHTHSLCIDNYVRCPTNLNKP